MYIGAKQKKKFLYFLIFLVLAILAGAGVFLLNWNVSESSKPKDVLLSNVWEGSVTVTWITEVKAEGLLTVYEKGEEVGDFKDARGAGKYHSHYVDIVGLKPNTIYEFEIYSAGEKRLNENGERFEFATRSVVPNLPTSNVVNGVVEGKDVLIFVLLDDLNSNYPLSTYSLNDGPWSLDLSKLLPTDSEEDFVLRADDSLKLLFFSEKGTEVVRGHKRLLFDEENFFVESPLSLKKQENIFLEISEIAKFKKDAIILDEPVVKEEVEIEEIQEPEEPEEEEEIEEEEGIGWGALEDLL